MVETATRLPVNIDKKSEEKTGLAQVWSPFEALHREVDQLFESFGRDIWRNPFRRSAFDIEPFWQREMKFVSAPAVDIVEREGAYEITADLPGLDEKNVEVQVSNGNLTIRGEKKEEKEEKKKDFYLQERRFGSFERTFGVPEGVDIDKIEANFKKGVLTVTLPKKPEAQQAAKTINVKAA
jgi:HSP20 family protein